MTKKLTHFEPQLALELDLDSFLNSHISLSNEDDDDNDLSSVPHRTTDEILNNTSSSLPSNFEKLGNWRKISGRRWRTCRHSYAASLLLRQEIDDFSERCSRKTGKEGCEGHQEGRGSCWQHVATLENGT
ncbi:hypothetical protein COP2_035552 [Malus domestica]